MNKEEIKYMVENKASLIALKKATIKHCDSVDVPREIKARAFEYAPDDNLEAGSIKRVIVGNTYNWLDSHGDVHMEGVFSKTLKESKHKIIHLHDHIFQLTAKVGEPIDIFEQKINWIDLGVSKVGDTTALMMYSEIRKDYNSLIFDQYVNRKINQHSVGMIYVNLFLCVNDADFKEEFAGWNKYSPKVANIEKAVEKGYFWAITEAKLIEISAVIAGSNEITPTIEPTKAAPEVEPVKETQFAEYFIKNFKL